MAGSQRVRAPNSPPKSPKLTQPSCRRCRRRKVKCSGTAPCFNCASRHQSCVFDEADRRVVISERHLRELENRVAVSHGRNPRTSSPLPFLGGSRSQEERNGRVVRPPRASETTSEGRLPTARSPGNSPRSISEPRHENLVGLKEQRGGYGGQSISIFTLGRQTLYFLDPRWTENGGPFHNDKRQSYSYPSHLDAKAEMSSIDLPPNDYILHLGQVADFHLNANHCYFDYETFKDQLRRLSTASLQTVTGMLRVKVLLVIALGKLFLERGASHAGPPGIREFLHGVRNIPTSLEISEDPVSSVETLCLLAIYAQSAHLHHAAYLYIGRASRIARSSRLDSSLKQTGDTTEPSSVQKLWWTVCILDQQQSEVIHASPDLLPQETTKASTGSDEYGDNTWKHPLCLRVAVAGLLTRVTAALKHEKISSPSFSNYLLLELIRSRSVAQNICNASPLCNTESLQTISRSVAVLHLSYYHFIIIATQPILIQNLQTRATQQVLHLASHLVSGVGLQILKTCINAASRSLNIISALHEQNLLETFTFFDLEITFVAGLSLVLASTIVPVLVEPTLVDIASKILRDMGQRGNIPAEYLETELKNANGAMTEFFSGVTDRHIPRKGPTVLSDGHLLNDTILHVIESDHEESYDLQNPSMSHQVDLDMDMVDELVQREEQRSVPQPPDTSTGGVPVEMPQVSADSQVPQQHDSYLAFAGDLEDQFTFDMVNLQWLDAVQ